MKYSLKNGSVFSLVLAGDVVTFPWGIEFADRSSFFSEEEGSGWGFDVKKFLFEEGENSFCSEKKIDISGKMVSLEKNVQFLSNRITHSVSLMPINNSVMLMDFVLHYQFKKDFFNFACISNKEIQHKNSNIYHQYEVDSCSLIGDEYKLSFSVEKSHFDSSSIRQVLYVRDFKDRWVVHARLLPRDVSSNSSIIKLNTRWYNRAIPNFLSDILLAKPQIKNYLWYRMEREPYKRTNPVMKYILKPSAYNLFELDKKEMISLTVNLDIHELR